MKYDFSCLECGWVGELNVAIEERDDQICPDCDAELFRNFSMPPVIYKARGFVTTDERSLKRKIVNNELHPILDKDTQRKRDAAIKEARKTKTFQDS